MIKVIIQTKTNSAGKAKEWPFFEELISLNPEVNFVEVLIEGQNPTKGAAAMYGTRKEILQELKDSDMFISIDSWLQHLASMQTDKLGLVIFSRSNPAIFGYPKFANVFENTKYFKSNPYEAWSPVDIMTEAFPSIEIVQKTFLELLHIVTAKKKSI